MSDFGIFASRLQINNDTLKEFEDSLRYLRTRKIPSNQEQDEYCLERLNNVIRSIVDNLNGNLSNTMLLDDRNIVDCHDRILGKHLGKDELGILDNELKKAGVIP